VTLRRWLSRNLKDCNPAKPIGQLWLFIDEFTDHNDTGVGIAAVRLLTSLGYRVLTVRHSPSARTHISKGFLRKARKHINRNIEIFSPLVSEETPLVGLEPSAILGFRDEYPDLAGEAYREKARSIAKNTLLFEEFIVREYRKGNITADMFTDRRSEVLVHVHCQQKSIATSASVTEALGIPSGYSVREIASGCCGMAGAFGYEKEHYDLSVKIGELVLFPEVRSASEKTLLSAPGTSCRHHIHDGTGRSTKHPAEILFEALKTKVKS
jgi:Fe-S oxidoreductase